MRDPIASEMVWLLRAVIRRYGKAIQRATSDAGFEDISTRALWVIGGLARHGGAAAPSTLVAELGVTKQAVSQLVETLVALGYLRRDDDPADRRRQVVALTTRGEQAARVIQAACVLVDSDVSRLLGDDMGRLENLLSGVVYDSSEFDRSRQPAT
jgi:DNA-binding MarR family transcriptional regulator